MLAGFKIGSFTIVPAGDWKPQVQDCEELEDLFKEVLGCISVSWDMDWLYMKDLS